MRLGVIGRRLSQIHGWQHALIAANKAEIADRSLFCIDCRFLINFFETCLLGRSSSSSSSSLECVQVLSAIADE